MTFEEFLDQNGYLVYKNVGTSMLPLIKQGRDSFTLKKKTNERCKRWDVILYSTVPGRYVLHRIVEVRDHDYVVFGDHCMGLEYGITDEHILAVMTAFSRKGKHYTIEHRMYRLYVFFCCKPYKFKIFYRRMLSKMKRLARKLKG